MARSMIARQNLKLNLVPGGVPPVLNVSQDDSAYDVHFTIYNGAQLFEIPDDVSIQFQETKRDGNGFTVGATKSAQTGQCYIWMQEQMSAVPGDQICELVLTNTTEDQIGTANFIMRVEPAALNKNTVISESEIAYANQVLAQLGSVAAYKAQLDAQGDDIEQLNTALTAEINRAKAAEAAEASARATADASLQAQINQLIAPSGSAPSAAEIENARVGADGTVYQTLGAAIRGQITDVNSTLNKYLGYEGLAKSDLSSFTPQNGAIASTGKWTNINASNQHIVIPVKARGATLAMTANNNVALYFAGVKTYSTPVSGASLDLSADAAWSGRITLAKNISGTYSIPDDVHFLVIVTLYSGTDATPASFTLTYPTSDFVQKVNDSVIPNDVLSGFNMNPDEWGVGTWTSVVGQTSVFNAQNARRYSPIYLYPHDLTISGDGRYKYMIITLNDSDVVQSITAYISTYTRISAGTRFRLIVQDGTDSTADISQVTDATLNASILIRNNDIPNRLYYGGVNWCCMGDSIAEGTMSRSDGQGGTETVVDRVNGWAYLVRDRNCWNLTNLAIGGSGFLDEATASGAHPVPAETPAWYVARHTDFTPYNLVTLSYGINDWKGNLPLGTIADDGSVATPTTIIQAIKATIEAIMASNPLCKIIVTTPLNIAGYSAEFGDKSTNYAVGYALSNTGTLAQFADAMIDVCEYYGIEYVDMTHQSCINRENLIAMLPDGVHPRLEAHDILAHEYGKKINF